LTDAQSESGAGAVEVSTAGSSAAGGGGADADGHAETNFVSSRPAQHFAALYAQHGLLGGHVIMLGRSAGTEEQALAALRAYPGGLQVGGGVHAGNARRYLDAGATHVIVTSYVFRDGDIDRARLAELVRAVGKERLVLDLSCRKRDGKYFVVTDRWQKFTDFEVNAANIRELAASCDEFLVHGVDVEGLRAGIQEDLVALLGDVSPIPVTYAGGARNLDDLARVRELGKGRVDLTIGSALDIFGGDLALDAVLQWQRETPMSKEG
jgi:phosphoribosylformimino-5-aminoimidazole carboxamide ribotide isomerase